VIPNFTEKDDRDRVRNPLNSALYKLTASDGARLLWLQVSCLSNKYVNFHASHVVLSQHLLSQVTRSLAGPVTRLLTAFGLCSPWEWVSHSILRQHYATLNSLSQSYTDVLLRNPIISLRRCEVNGKAVVCDLSVVCCSIISFVVHR